VIHPVELVGLKQLAAPVPQAKHDYYDETVPLV